MAAQGFSILSPYNILVALKLSPFIFLSISLSLTIPYFSWQTSILGVPLLDSSSPPRLKANHLHLSDSLCVNFFFPFILCWRNGRCWIVRRTLVLISLCLLLFLYSAWRISSLLAFAWYYGFAGNESDQICEDLPVLCSRVSLAVVAV
jgi:hypothetical protein